MKNNTNNPDNIFTKDQVFEIFKSKSKPKITEKLTWSLYVIFVESPCFAGKFQYSECHQSHLFELKDNSKINEIPRSGIYFLQVDLFITYIGMSTANIADRIIGTRYGLDGHRHNKVFDRFSVIEIADTSIIEQIEYTYINLFDPPHNKKDAYAEYCDYLPDRYKEVTNDGKEWYNKFQIEKSAYLSNLAHKSIGLK